MEVLAPVEAVSLDPTQSPSKQNNGIRIADMNEDWNYRGSKAAVMGWFMSASQQLNRRIIQ